LYKLAPGVVGMKRSVKLSQNFMYSTKLLPVWIRK